MLSILVVFSLFGIIPASMTATSTVTPTIDVSEFANEALLAHNLYRRIHGVPSLRLNSKLSEVAQKRARQLANDGKLSMQQNFFNGQSLGETVGSVSGFSSYNGVSATQLWYSVVSKFDEEGEASIDGASFTQIVWKKTEEVGFGIAKSTKENKVYSYSFENYTQQPEILNDFEKIIFR
jgi:hypothetical protein